MPVLAYIPFIHPINLFHDWWYLLLIPLAFGISVIYKALRLPKLDGFWQQVGVMTAQIVLAMIALAVFLLLIVVVVIPLIPAE
ncbi:MAG: hypothetical protein L0Y42_01145 [Phycisphaerales bacterium]|nr:hypothetical protein [Phycisphaerales bacterium]